MSAAGQPEQAGRVCMHQVSFRSCIPIVLLITCMMTLFFLRLSELFVCAVRGQASMHQISFTLSLQSPSGSTGCLASSPSGWIFYLLTRHLR
ncbi:hypothetical protein BJX70DRAFT_147327 [Aspergillus crustosus]